jgi:hypothetical protein
MDRPADIDAAIDLMARARNHLDGRSADTLEPALVRDLVSALTALTFAVDRHRPEVRGGCAPGTSRRDGISATVAGAVDRTRRAPQQGKRQWVT